MSTLKCKYCGKEIIPSNGYYNYPYATLCVECNDEIFKDKKPLSVKETIHIAQQAVIKKKSKKSCKIKNNFLTL